MKQDKPEKGRATVAPCSGDTFNSEHVPDAPEIRRLHVLFAGTVQGVGFRYAALSIARRYAVTGWVRNLSDGRVELAAEGQARELEAFLADLGEEMANYIGKVDRTWEPATGEWKRFTISASS